MESPATVVIQLLTSEWQVVRPCSEMDDWKWSLFRGRCCCRPLLNYLHSQVIEEIQLLLERELLYECARLRQLIRGHGYLHMPLLALLYYVFAIA
jgi:hypothetical protein